MIVQYRDIGLISDNDSSYFSMLEAVIEAVDPYSQMSISRSPENYLFRIIPSPECSIDRLIKDIVQLNKMVGIEMDMSKSIKHTATLSFKIKI